MSMPLQTRVVDGRRVTASTAWWSQRQSSPHRLVTADPYLYCVHGVRLDRTCSSCPDEREAAT